MASLDLLIPENQTDDCSSDTNEARKRSHSYKLSIVEEEVSRCLTKRQRGIFVTMLLFATITSAQFGAAYIAKSLALLADCGSMTIDTVSYAVNLYAECVDSKYQERNQLIATALSIFILLGITGYVIWDSCNILRCDPNLQQNDVNAYIVFGFGAGGVVFDLIGLFALGQGKKEKSTSAADLNLYSAGLHVIADLMRSTTTLIESILIWFYNYESNVTDAWAALIVSSLILLPCLQMIREWVKEYFLYKRCEEELTPLLKIENKSCTK